MTAALKEIPEFPPEVDLAMGAARDAMTDEMVGRLATFAGDGMDLLDRLTRSGLASAIPALAQLVNNGDLDRLVQLARVYSSAEDALTDEMVGRMTDAAAGGLALLDQVNRSGLDKAIPVLSRMVANGELERLGELARVYASAQDALTDEMVGRIAETVGEGLSLLDRFQRGGASHLIDTLERLEASGALARAVQVLPRLVDRLETVDRLLAGVEKAIAECPPAGKGGLGGLWCLVSDPSTQDTLRFLLKVGGELRNHADSSR